MSNLKVGDFVRLTDKARKDFYQTDKNLEMFDRPSLENWDNQSFVSFVSMWLGFESGDQAGGIVNIINDTTWVRYFNPIFLDWRTGYYRDVDLIKVGSANE